MSKKPFPKYNALVIARDFERRSRLKMAVYHEQTAGQASFGKVQTESSLKAALKVLHEDKNYDILLITDCFSDHDIEVFMCQLKALSEEKYGVVLVIKSREEEESLACRLAKGFDGCLYEPFSVEMLRDISKLAEDVRKVNIEKRLSTAAQMVLDSLTEKIDQRALALEQGLKTDSFPEKLKQASRMFRTLSKDSIGEFYETLSDVTQKRKPFYSGPSQILKKKALPSGTK